jgi:RNA polymerase sigma-70 factor, ECF subfamily
LSEDSSHQLFAEIYQDLKLRARSIRGGKHSLMLDTTALVHETFLKLAQGKSPGVDREHLARTAALAMRQVVIDHARAMQTEKRGASSSFITLTDLQIEAPDAPDRLLQLIEAMDQLRKIYPRMADTFSLRVFAGLTLEEIAELQNVSHMTCARDFQTARAYLLSLIS